MHCLLRTLYYMYTREAKEKTARAVPEKVQKLLSDYYATKEVEGIRNKESFPPW